MEPCLTQVSKYLVSDVIMEMVALDSAYPGTISVH